MLAKPQVSNGIVTNYFQMELIVFQTRGKQRKYFTAIVENERSNGTDAKNFLINYRILKK